MPNCLICPVCRNTSFSVKYEATYVYSYLIDGDAPGLKNTNELLPFMFDSREQKEAKQFLECNSCKTRFPCLFDKEMKMEDCTALQKSIDSHHALSQG